MEQVEVTIQRLFTMIEYDAGPVSEIVKEQQKVILYLLPFYQMASSQFMYPDGYGFTSDDSDDDSDDDAKPEGSKLAQFLGQQQI